MIKASAILAAAFCVTWLLRKRAAAERHMVWACAIIAAALLPLLSLVLPAWQSGLAERVAAALPAIARTNSIQNVSDGGESYSRTSLRTCIGWTGCFRRWLRSHVPSIGSIRCSGSRATVYIEKVNRPVTIASSILALKLRPMRSTFLKLRAPSDIPPLFGRRQWLWLDRPRWKSDLRRY